MPRHRAVYDKDLKETPEFQFLYNKWSKVLRPPHCDAFYEFMDFYNWSMSNGFVLGAKLRLIDESKPYGPENCFWEAPKKDRLGWSEDERAWISLWNKTVNRIRVHHSMEPFAEKGEA